MGDETKKEMWNLIMRKVPETFILVAFIYTIAIFGLGWIYKTLTESEKLDDEYIQNITYVICLLIIILTILFICVCIYVFIKRRKIKKSEDLPEGKIDAFVVEQDAESRDEKFNDINKNVKKTYWVLGVSLTSMVDREAMLKRMVNSHIHIRLCMMNPDIAVEDLCLSSVDNNACNLNYLLEKIKNGQMGMNDIKYEFKDMKNCKDMLEIYHILISAIHFKEYYDTDTDYKNRLMDSYKNLKEIRNTIVQEHEKYSFELGIADSFMPISLTIVDAEEEFGRMIVEFHLPFTQYRVLFEINKEDNNDLFSVFVEFYNIVWERAKKIE